MYQELEIFAIEEKFPQNNCTWLFLGAIGSATKKKLYVFEEAWKRSRGTFFLKGGSGKNNSPRPPTESIKRIEEQKSD